MALIENILGESAHRVVNIKPDYIVINDGSGHEITDLIGEQNIAFDVEKIITIIDHDVPAGNSESSVIFQKLVTFSKTHHLPFIQAKGASYLVMLESFVKENDIVVSCGSHNAIYGSIGALGLNIDAGTMAHLLLNGEYNLPVPESVLVTLQGTLASDCSPIDLFIHFLGRSDKAVLKNRVIEFTGDGLQKMSSHDKRVLCSMATRTGALSALVNDTPCGEYAAQLFFDTRTVTPAIALPVVGKATTDFSYKTISEVADSHFDVGFIGGFTGGYLEDLREVARHMAGKKISLGFRLNICPASSEIYLQAMDEGLLETFINFGAQILAPSDRNITLSGAGVVGSQEKVITTGCYNYSGCLGSDDASVYIASVKSVVMAALG